MEKYAACVSTSEVSMQIVITLPQSKIGYTYPEVYLCMPKKNGHSGTHTLILQQAQHGSQTQRRSYRCT